MSAAIAPPRGLRRALVPLLDRAIETDSPRERRIRAASFRQVSTAFRAAGLAAVGVGELELLADALDCRAAPESSSSARPDDESPAAARPGPPAGRAAAGPYAPEPAGRSSEEVSTSGPREAGRASAAAGGGR